METSSVSAPKPLNEEGPTPVVSLTQKAIEFIRDFGSKSPENAGKMFRISVEGGGCSGFQYGFSFDTKKEDDLVISCEDIPVLVDTQTRVYLHGSTVDYVSDLKGSGFQVHNPQAKGTCGCGVSFTV